MQYRRLADRTLVGLFLAALYSHGALSDFKVKFREADGTVHEGIPVSFRSNPIWMFEFYIDGRLHLVRVPDESRKTLSRAMQHWKQLGREIDRKKSRTKDLLNSPNAVSLTHSDGGKINVVLDPYIDLEVSQDSRGHYTVNKAMMRAYGVQLASRINAPVNTGDTSIFGWKLARAPNVAPDEVVGVQHQINLLKANVRLGNRYQVSTDLAEQRLSLPIGKIIRDKHHTYRQNVAVKVFVDPSGQHYAVPHSELESAKTELTAIPILPEMLRHHKFFEYQMLRRANRVDTSAFGPGGRISAHLPIRTADNATETIAAGSGHQYGELPIVSTRRSDLNTDSGQLEKTPKQPTPTPSPNPIQLKAQKEFAREGLQTSPRVISLTDLNDFFRKVYPGTSVQLEFNALRRTEQGTAECRWDWNVRK